MRNEGVTRKVSASVLIGSSLAAGWALAKAPLAAPILLVTGLVAAARWYRAIRLDRSLTERLADAAAGVGGPDFQRPLVEGASPRLDRIAATLAARDLALGEASEGMAICRQNMDALFRTVPNPLLIVDGDGVVRKVNDAVAELFGIEAIEAHGRPFLHVVREHQIDDAVASVLAENERRSLEVEVLTAKAPARFTVTVEPIAVTSCDERAGAVVLMTDITRLHHLERVHQEFIANVSHELRTPITSIIGFVQTLLEDDLPEDTRRRFLRILKTEADRLDALLTDLLDLTLLESDKQPIRRDEVDLGQLVANVFNLLEPQARRKKIETELQVPPDFPTILAHRGMIEQALVNLIDNAIKYSPAGSTVRVEVGRVGTAHVELSVIDDGPGIPSEHLPRLFERFYRVDKARSRSVGGTGLGLAIVRHIVQRHGGAIRAESRLGKGSRFIVTLPLQAEEAPVPSWDE